MSSIYLIRHGQASFGQANYDQLSDLGQQQASRLGQVLNQRIEPFDAICLGSMKRHKQTAINCLKGFSLEYEQCSATVDDGWNEYDHEDILRQYRPEFETPQSLMAYMKEQKNPKEAFEADFNAAINRWISGQYDSEYNESWSDFTSRVHLALKNTLLNNPTKKNIAVFTSGGPISLVSQSLLGVPAEKIMQMNWTLLNCGVTKLVSTGSRLFLASLNEHTHFEGLENKRFLSYT